MYPHPDNARIGREARQIGPEPWLDHAEICTYCRCVHARGLIRRHFDDSTLRWEIARGLNYRVRRLPHQSDEKRIHLDSGPERYFLALLGGFGGCVMRFPSVFALAFLAMAAPPPSLLGASAVARPAPARTCGADSYINSSGHCVHRPVRASRAPVGASARCRDGTYSFSEHRSGTCSHHGGVAEWLL